ncbi:MAG: S4 domain-containing protein YaaA [Candidatus Izemoplasmatales bacterium]|jgi:S4 domain protein YaaA|nr:S4 domain-containing protein YaaA [Candidatus Izemoplasmatales bacterium]MDY0139685.1 S4 domain-containing protein YaaA [Candidatus Izemoplasmatales bacterium]
MKDVRIKTEYITLGQLVKFLSLVSSGGEVKFFLLDNPITVNNELESRRGKKLYPQDVIQINNKSYRIVK